MESKKILVLVSDTPYGKRNITEMLRTTTGITAGYKEHAVNILFTGDSVLYALMPIDQGYAGKLLKSLRFINSGLYIDKKSIDDRNIAYDLIEEPFKLVERNEIHALVQDSQITISL